MFVLGGIDAVLGTELIEQFNSIMGKVIKKASYDR
jgi:hypothetical protein